MTDKNQQALFLHQRIKGKIATRPKFEIYSNEDLSLAYTPGVAAVCKAIEKDPGFAYKATIKHNTVAIVTDGTAVLGLGDIGPLAALPVMEGKALLLKHCANVDAFPICLDTKDTDEIVETVKRIAPVFGGVNLEDISAPRCFEIEERLQDLGIPVFHDDQHGTAIVLLAALINACELTGKEMKDLRVVINGAGAAGTAISKLLKCVGHAPEHCEAVSEILVCDRQGIIYRDRPELSWEKRDYLAHTNHQGMSGSLHDALCGADVFIGVSQGNLLSREDIQSMAKGSIIFALANPEPEILPDEAKAGGAAIVGTGRSDFPNQVNNLLAFPGIFRGALDSRATRITERMKIAAAYALANATQNLSVDHVLPQPLNPAIAPLVARAVYDAAVSEGVGVASERFD